MKKEELIELGVDEEVAKNIMALHGKTITGLNAQINSLESERDQFKEQVASNQAELDVLKESAKGNEELEKKLNELQTSYDTFKAESESKAVQQKKESAIKLALKDANPADESIVFGLLNTDTIQVNDDGVQGLKEQLESLQEGKPFLFKQEAQAEQTPQIVVGGNPKGTEQGQPAIKNAQQQLNQHRITL